MMFGIYAAAHTADDLSEFAMRSELSLLNNYFIVEKGKGLFLHRQREREITFYWFSTSNQKVKWKKEDFLMFYWCFYNKLHFPCLPLHQHSISLLVVFLLPSSWHTTPSTCYQWNVELMSSESRIYDLTSDYFVANSVNICSSWEIERFEASEKC